MIRACISIIATALFCIFVFPLPSRADEKAGEQIKWQVLSGGGQWGNSTSFILVGTVGQTAVGGGIAGGKTLHHGFWQDFGMGIFICGDVNSDGLVNILDIIFLINFKFKGGPAPEIMAAADVNSDGLVNILDIIYLIDYKFKGGPEPNCP